MRSATEEQMTQLRSKVRLAFIATRNGGTLRFSDGDYQVGNLPNFKGLTLPSGIIIQGTNSLQSNNFSNNIVQKNPSRITLNGAINVPFFALVNARKKLSSKTSNFLPTVIKILTVSKASVHLLRRRIFILKECTFSKFFRGIYAHGLPVTNQQWQFDYVKLNHCRFMFQPRCGTLLRCPKFRLEDSIESFYQSEENAGVNANSMHFERVAGVLIEDTYGGGFANALGGTFINVLDSGPITVITSQTEAMTKSLAYNEVENPYAGDYSYPITFHQFVFGNPIEFKARRTFVSTGNLYLANTFKADERVRVYSTGDRFCYDGYTLGCQGTGTPNNFDKATVIFMTGQPGERGIPDRPTFFGTDVQFGAPVQMPNFLQNQLPNGKPNGSMVYCTNCRRNTQTLSSRRKRRAGDGCQWAMELFVKLFNLIFQS